MEILLAGLVFASLFMVGMAVVGQVFGERAAVMARLEEYTEEISLDPATEHLNQPLSQRVLLPLWEKLQHLGKRLSSPERKLSYQKKLIAAGEPYGLDAEGLVVLKYGFMSGLALVGIVVGTLNTAVVLGIIGYLLPDFLLKAWKDERRNKILKSMPDVLDMLSVSVEAGLGFDAALQKVVEKIEGPLSGEFQRTLNEIKLGKPRRVALKDLAARVEVDDVSTFISSLVQADQLGVSIANVLRVQADQVREKRSQRAEEQAQKAPVKILIPLVFFIFPAIFIILLGPAVIQLISTFG
jgi:tight adherence protein C